MARVPVELDEGQLKKAVAAIRKTDDEDSDSSKYEAIQAVVKGISRPQAAKLLYAAEVVIKPSIKIKLSPTTYKKAKADGLRNERIAARSGKSMGELKAWLVDNNIDAIYSGKGRRFDGSTPNHTKAAEKPASGRKPGRPKKSETAAEKAAAAKKVRKRAALQSRP